MVTPIMMPYYKLYTHNDLDGVACAALARAAFGDNIDISIVSDPGSLTDLLINLAEGQAWKNYDLIYVTDLSFNPTPIKDSHMFQRIRMFDHHKTAIDRVKGYEDQLNVTTEKGGRQTCAAQLWYDYLQQICLLRHKQDYFVETVRQYDTWDWKKSGMMAPRYLSNLNYHLGHDYFIKTFSDRMLEGEINVLNMFNEYERDILLFCEKQEKKAIEKVPENTKVVQHGNLKCGVIINPGYESLAGNEICTKLGADIAVIVNTKHEALNFRTIRKDIDVSEIAKKMGGGGHRQAAGAPMPEGFMADFISFLVRRLPPLSEA